MLVGGGRRGGFLGCGSGGQRITNLHGKLIEKFRCEERDGPTGLPTYRQLKCMSRGLLWSWGGNARATMGWGREEGRRGDERENLRGRGPAGRTLGSWLGSWVLGLGPPTCCSVRCCVRSSWGLGAGMMAAGGFQCWLLALPRPRKSLHTAHRQSALAPTRQRPSTVRGSKRFAGRQAGGDPCWPPIRLLVGPCQADSRGPMRQGDAGHRIGTGLAIVPHVPSVPPCGRPPLASTKTDRRSPHTPRPAHRPEWFTTGNPLARNLPTVYRSITARRHRKRRAWAGLSDGLSWLGPGLPPVRLSRGSPSVSSHNPQTQPGDQSQQRAVCLLQSKRQGMSRPNLPASHRPAGNRHPKHGFQPSRPFARLLGSRPDRMGRSRMSELLSQNK